MKALLYKPLMKFLEERQQQISDDMDNARLDRDKAQILVAEKKEELKSASNDARDIREVAKRRAEDTATGIINQAKDQGKKILQDTETQVEHEQKKAMETLQGDLAQLVSSLSSKIIKKEMSGDLDDELINSLLSEKR